MRHAVVALSALLLLGCMTVYRDVSTDHWPTYLPIPNDVKIVPPAPTLPPALQAFSGRWVGVYRETMLIGVIIEQIYKEEAVGIITGIAHNGKHYGRVRFLVLPWQGGHRLTYVRHGDDYRVELTMAAPPDLAFESEYRKELHTVTLHKVR